MGKFFIYLVGVFAELERDNILKTTRAGMVQRAKNGLR